MSSAFNPGYIIDLYINTKLPETLKSKKKKEKKSLLKYRFFYGIISPQPNKPVRDKRIHISFQYYQIGDTSVTHFSANFYQLYIKM